MSTSTQHLDQARLALAESLEARRANKLDTADYYLSVAHAHAAFASVEEQRTANLIAAYNGDLLKNPHPVGTDANNEWWAKTAGDLTERVGVQR